MRSAYLAALVLTAALCAACGAPAVGDRCHPVGATAQAGSGQTLVCAPAKDAMMDDEPGAWALRPDHH